MKKASNGGSSVSPGISNFINPSWENLRQLGWLFGVQILNIGNGGFFHPLLFIPKGLLILPLLLLDSSLNLNSLLFWTSSVKLCRVLLGFYLFLRSHKNYALLFQNGSEQKAFWPRFFLWHWTTGRNHEKEQWKMLTCWYWWETQNQKPTLDQTRQCLGPSYRTLPSTTRKNHRHTPLTTSPTTAPFSTYCPCSTNTWGCLAPAAWHLECESPRGSMVLLPYLFLIFNPSSFPQRPSNWPLNTFIPFLYFYP